MKTLNPGKDMKKISAQRTVMYILFSMSLFLQASLFAAKKTDASVYMKPKVYIVREGDVLYEIAAKKEIYGDKRLWPVIYYANRDILYDYKLLVEGQKLIIPSSISGAEKEEAIQKALDMNWPSPGVKDTGAVSSKGLDKAKLNSAYSLELKQSVDNANNSKAQEIMPTVRTITVIKEITVTIPEEDSGEIDYMTAMIIALIAVIIGLIIFYFADEAYRHKRRFLKLKKRLEMLAKENNFKIPGSSGPPEN